MIAVGDLRKYLQVAAWPSRCPPRILCGVSMSEAAYCTVYRDTYLYERISHDDILVVGGCPCNGLNSNSIST